MASPLRAPLGPPSALGPVAKRSRNRTTNVLYVAFPLVRRPLGGTICKLLQFLTLSQYNCGVRHKRPKRVRFRTNASLESISFGTLFRDELLREDPRQWISDAALWIPIWKMATNVLHVAFIIGRRPTPRPDFEILPVFELSVHPNAGDLTNGSQGSGFTQTQKEKRRLFGPSFGTRFSERGRSRLYDDFPIDRRPHEGWWWCEGGAGGSYRSSLSGSEGGG